MQLLIAETVVSNYKMISAKNYILLIYSIFYFGHAVAQGSIALDRGFSWVAPLKYQYLEFVNDSVLLFGLDNKYGLMNSSGLVILEPTYETIWLNSGVLIFKSQEKKGVLNEKGKIVIDPIYESIKVSISGCIIGAFKNGEYSLFNRDGTMFSHQSYEDFYQYSDGSVSVRKNGKRGLLSNKGRVLAKCRYSEAYMLKSNLIFIKKGSKVWLLNLHGKRVNRMTFDESLGRRKNRKYYLNSNGKVLPRSYQNGLPFESEVTGVQENGLWGIIDTTGKWIVKPKYTAFRILGNGLFYISEDARTVRLINSNGKLVNSARYQWAGRFNHALVKTKDSVGIDLINKNGKSVLPYKFEEISNLENGHGLIYQNNKYGVCNTLGKIIIPVKFQSIKLKDSAYIVEYKSGTQLLDLNGELIRDFPFGSIVFFRTEWEQDYHCDSCVFAYVNSWGLGLKPINLKGEYLTQWRPVVPHAYPKVSVFMFVDLKGKIGFKSKSNEVLIKPQYDEVVPLYSDSSEIYYRTDIAGKLGLVNNMGQILIEPEFDELWRYEDESVAHLIKNDLYGLYHIKYNRWLNPQFEEEIEINRNFMIVQNDGSYGLIEIIQ